MDWIHLEVGLPDHPKVGRLSRRLQIDRDRALAIVIRLLCWTARAKEDGHLNGTDPEDIAEVCRYDGDPDALVRSLVASGWLDEEEGALTVHDWMDRQGRLLRARERERARRASDATHPVPQRGAACDTLPQRGAACGERRGEERRSTTPPTPPPDGRGVPPDPAVTKEGLLMLAKSKRAQAKDAKAKGLDKDALRLEGEAHAFEARAGGAA